MLEDDPTCLNFLASRTGDLLLAHDRNHGFRVADECILSWISNSADQSLFDMDTPRSIKRGGAGADLLGPVIYSGIWLWLAAWKSGRNGGGGTSLFRWDGDFLYFEPIG